MQHINSSEVPFFVCGQMRKENNLFCMKVTCYWFRFFVLRSHQHVVIFNGKLWGFPANDHFLGHAFDRLRAIYFQSMRFSSHTYVYATFSYFSTIFVCFFAGLMDSEAWSSYTDGRPADLHVRRTISGKNIHTFIHPLCTHINIG